MSDWSYCYKLHHVLVHSSLSDPQHAWYVTFWNVVWKWVLKILFPFVQRYSIRIFLSNIGVEGLEWNVRCSFLCFVLLTDCDHQGAVVLHNCTQSYTSYGTEVIFQSSDVVCMCIVLVSLLCKINLLFIYSCIPVSSSSIGWNTASQSKSLSALSKHCDI